MKALILCAGYATRLYPFTVNQPKPLLPIGDRPIIDHIMDRLKEVKELDEVIIVTNNRFYTHFSEWAAGAKTSRKLTIINDKTLTNEDRLGAVGDINLALDECNIDDDLIVVAGDNLFKFHMQRFVDFFMKRKESCSIALHDIKSLEDATRFGVVAVDDAGKVVSFTEKPSEPASTLVAICLYYFPKNKLGRIREFMGSSSHKDAPGHYIKWLTEQEAVYGFVFDEDWHDIGDKTTYAAIKELYENKK